LDSDAGDSGADGAEVTGAEVEGALVTPMTGTLGIAGTSGVLIAEQHFTLRLFKAVSSPVRHKKSVRFVSTYLRTCIINTNHIATESLIFYYQTLDNVPLEFGFRIFLGQIDTSEVPYILHS